MDTYYTKSPMGEVLIDYNYAYDLNGNRLQKVSNKHSNFYTYDSMNRLKEANYDGRKKSFTYDKVGNRLTKTTNDITEKYIYNVKIQLKELHNKNGINYFTYDKQGNTIKEEAETGSNIFEYNTLNQQVKVITKDGNTLVSRYDTEGLRAEIEENEKLTKFIFHKENVLLETDKEFNVISRFTRGYEVVAADIEDLGDVLNSEVGSKLKRYYYNTDEQGSTVLITDKYRNIRNEYHYDAFGCVLESKEQVHNRITYTGQQFDGVTGQYYLRARFYNPVIGRFTQEDTYRGDGLNLYAYCGNNPVGYYDPSGYVCSTKINQINDEEKTMRQDGTRLEYLRNKFNKGGCKAVPNPNVKNGGLPHQTTIGNIKPTSVNGRMQTEYKYNTPNGTKSYRYADKVEVVDGEVTKIYQAGKVSKNGLPITRESKAIEDIMNSTEYNGAPIYFMPYNSNMGPIIYLP